MDKMRNINLSFKNRILSIVAFSVLLLVPLGTENVSALPYAINDPVTLVDNTGRYSSLAIGTDGYPVISYRDSTDRDLKVVHCTNTNCTTSDTPVTLDSTNLWDGTSIAIGADGFPVISYYTFTDRDLKVVHCTNTNCTTSDTPVTLDSTDDVGMHSSIAIGTDGFPVISYGDSTNHDLKVVHCTNASCSTSDTPVTLDSTDNVGRHTSIAIGTDGFPVIAYVDITNDDLNVVHCTNASCSTSDTPVILGSSDYAGATSIAIGTDGYPVIAYVDGTNYKNNYLNVVHCTNASCSTSDTPTTLDNSDDLVQYPSIAIGSYGNPVIAYGSGYYADIVESPLADLKVVSCANASCSDFGIPVIIDKKDGDNFTSAAEDISMAIDSNGFPSISYHHDRSGDLKFVQLFSIISCGDGTTLNSNTLECEPDVTQADLDALQTIIDDLNVYILELLAIIAGEAPLTEEECADIQANIDKKTAKGQTIPPKLLDNQIICDDLYS